MKARQFLLATLIFFSIGLLSSCGSQAKVSSPNHPTTISQKYTKSNTPTLYLHGFGGGAGSTNSMIQAAVDAQAANKAMVIHVTNQGKLKITGTLTKKKDNPIIQVVMDNPRAGLTNNIKYLRTILRTLATRYHVTKYNGVGHSMGASTLVAYNLQYGNQTGMPKLQRLVAIAGPFNGIIGRGFPGQPGDVANKNKLLKNDRPKTEFPTYKVFVKQRKNFPKQVKVLNMYGNLDDGSHSDSRVSNVSAQSLRYLIKGRVASYRELMVRGKNAQHSKLHDHNETVNRNVIEFVW